MGRPKGKKSTMRTPQEKEALILKWRDSGLGLKRFAKSNGIPISPFRVWVARYRAGGLGALESKTGKGKGPGKGRPKKSMTMVEELELENLRLRIEVERLKKRLYRGRRWFSEGIRSFKEREIEIARSFVSEGFSASAVCRVMGIPRSSFYASSRSGARKADSEAQRDCCIALIKEVRKGRRTHGYRWINAEMRRRFGVVYTDNFVHRCCKWAGIRADIGRVRHRRPRSESVICPNLRPSWHPEGPLEVVTSDMTILRHRKGPIELTLYIDAFNNEIASYGASRRAGDTRPYFDGLEGLARKMKKEQRSQKLVLHTDQGSVYSSVRFNDLCEKYSIIHSMSRAGTPTDNPMDESINGWMKDELYGDFGFYESDDPFKLIDRYVKYWNNQRFSCALNYKTPTEYKLNRG